MATLRELRERLGATQAAVARKLDISIPAFSNYETGAATPPLEDMIILERNFDHRVEWPDAIPGEDKREIMEAITALSEHYPLMAVLTFAQKWIKQDVRLGGSPSRSVKHFAQQSESLGGIEPLLPPGM